MRRKIVCVTKGSNSLGIIDSGTVALCMWGRTFCKWRYFGQRHLRIWDSPSEQPSIIRFELASSSAQLAVASCYATVARIRGSISRVKQLTAEHTAVTGVLANV